MPYSRFSGPGDFGVHSRLFYNVIIQDFSILDFLKIETILESSYVTSLFLKHSQYCDSLDFPIEKSWSLVIPWN